MASINYIYCDACFFIAYFKNEEGRVASISGCFEEVLDDINKKLVTSMLSVTEVALVAAERFDVSREIDEIEMLDKLWRNTSLVELVEYNFSLARRARALVRRFNGLKPPDAIHLATAQLVGVPKFYTYDDKLLKLSEKFEFDIENPPIGQPRLKQLSLLD